MNFLDIPPLFAGLAAVSFMILAGSFVALTIVTPIFVVLVSPILVPAVFTLSFLATGFLASGSLGASAIALLVWLYKKEEEKYKYTLHTRVNKPVGANKLRGRVKPADEKKLAKEEKSLGVNKAEISIPQISKVLLEEQNPIGPKSRSPSTATKRSHQIGFAMNSTKTRSTFMKEYQKVPRIGAFAYKYLTSRDKNT